MILGIRMRCLRRNRFFLLALIAMFSFMGSLLISENHYKYLDPKYHKRDVYVRRAKFYNKNNTKYHFHLEEMKQENFTNKAVVEYIIGVQDKPWKKNPKYKHLKMPKFKWILNDKNKCNKKENLEFIFLIYSSPDHFDERDVARQTWANGNSFKGLVYDAVFLVGSRKDPSIQKRLKLEHEEFGDVFQTDLIDSYQNLSMKGIAMMKWIKDYCKNVPIVLKADDDVYVDMLHVLSLVERIKEEKHKRSIVGLTVGPGQHIDRDNISKFSIPYDVIPNHDSFPLYVNGWAYLFTRDIVEDWYHAAMNTPLFYIDDVYLTGFAASQIPGVKYYKFNIKDRMIEDSSIKAISKCKSTLSCPMWSSAFMYEWCHHMRKGVTMKKYKTYLQGSQALGNFKKDCKFYLKHKIYRRSKKY